MDSTARIRELNDAFRTGFAGDGRVYVTAGIAAMSPAQQVEVMRRVHCFIAFTPDNDPYGEHDFGSFEYAGKTIFWKVDCYDRDLNYGSPDPSDEIVTTRVMTVMLRFATRTICRAAVAFPFGRPAMDHQWKRDRTVARAAPECSVLARQSDLSQ
jgi:hypothetical protein